MWNSSWVMEDDNSGKVQYSLLLLMMVVMLLLTFMNLENRIVLTIREKVDSALVMSAFSAAQADSKAICENINIHKSVTEKEIIYDFEKMFEETYVVLDSDKVPNVVKRILQENVKACNSMKRADTDYNISRITVYNVTDNLEITEYVDGRKLLSKVEHYDSEKYVYSPNGVCINVTSIYLKVEFNLSDIFGKSRKVYLEKCIQIKLK